MAISTPSELTELVNDPTETLGVEHKRWLDLKDHEARANLARHIAALANFGGGHIVFGFEDDMSLCEPSPYPSDTYSHDAVAGIVKKYLEPPLQCDVRWVSSAAGNEHLVIIVPPHGATPICAKTNGPDKSGKPVGVTAGQYYLRKPGPASEAIVSAAEWGPLIRRCAMHERTAIIAALQGALAGQTGAQEPTSADLLKAWHQAAATNYAERLNRLREAPLAKTDHYQLSYLINAGGEQLPLGNLKTILREVNFEVTDTVRTGWSMFHIFDVQEFAPRFAVDEALSESDEFLQVSFVEAEQSDFSAFDLWRVAPDGRATIGRTYWEDHPFGRTPPGVILDPKFLLTDLAELVRHARGLAERFAAPIDVSFRCEWAGLAKRTLGGGRWTPRPPPGVDRRLATRTWPVGELSTNLEGVVAALAGPVFRTFGIEELATPQWVAQQRAGWARV